MAPARKDVASAAYFERYTAIQEYKHHVLRHYLGGWFPKISKAFPKVIYIETHAGAGMHKGGEKGSPIIALETLLQHPQRAALLSRCQFSFILIESDPENFQQLKSLVRSMALPEGIIVRPGNQDFRDEFARAIANSKGLAPAFTFVDPFGYSVALDFIRGLISQPSGEVFVTFMSQAVARAAPEGTKAGLLTELYGSDAWRPLADIEDFEERKAAAVRLYKDAVGARWCTSLRMRARTDYSLMHFTNHPEGRNLMKYAMWKADETGSFQVTGHRDLKQPLLIEQEPDLFPLATMIREALGGQTVYYPEILVWNLDTDYRDTHLNQVLTRGRKEGWIETAHTGKVGPSMATIPITIRGL